MWFVFIFVFRLLTSTWCQTWVLVDHTVKSSAYYLIWKQTQKFIGLMFCISLSHINTALQPKLPGISTFACVCCTKLLLWWWQQPLLVNSQPKTFDGTYFLNLPFNYSIRYFSIQSHSFSPLSLTKGMGLPRGPSYKRWIKVFNKDSRSTNICLMVIISWE